MSAPYHRAKRKTEDAVELVLQRLGGAALASSAVAYSKGFGRTALTVPRIEIIAAQADPEEFEGLYTGNFLVDLSIAVVSHCDDETRAQHDALCGAVEDVIFNAQIEAALNACSVADYTVFENGQGDQGGEARSGWFPGQSQDLVSESEMMSRYAVKVYCRPSGRDEQ